MNSEAFTDHIGRWLGQTGQALGHRLGQMLLEQGFDLIAPQAVLLRKLKNRELVNQQELAQFLHRDKASATRWIDALEKKGLVQRVPNRHDRRQNIILITDEGLSLCSRMESVFDGLQQTALAGIDEEDLKTCRNVLMQIRINLGE